MVERLVIRIDHMNRRAAYLRKLRNWSRELGILGLAFLRNGGTRRPRGAEGVVLCLCGDGYALRSFATRLRTEHVDVDRRGKKCKEKQSKVLLDVAPCTSPLAKQETGLLEEREYTTRDDLLAMVREVLGPEDGGQVQTML